MGIDTNLHPNYFLAFNYCVSKDTQSLYVTKSFSGSATITGYNSDLERSATVLHQMFTQSHCFRRTFK